MTFRPTTGPPRPSTAYVEVAALEEPKAALLQTVDPAGRRLTGRALDRRLVLAMTKRILTAAGLPPSTCCHHVANIRLRHMLIRLRPAFRRPTAPSRWTCSATPCGRPRFDDAVGTSTTYLASGVRDDRPGIRQLPASSAGDVLVVACGCSPAPGRADRHHDRGPGRLVFGIFAALAEFERGLLTRERTVAGFKAAGAGAGGTPVSAAVAGSARHRLPGAGPGGCGRRLHAMIGH